jgi:SAM-dependent methyltransferase
MHLTPEEQTGVYARKQLLSRDRLIAWSHGRRFQVALDLAARVGGSRVLDYGCGDGSFLALLRRGADAPAYAVGVEIAPDLVADCRSRLSQTGVLFMHVDELGAPAAAFDTIYCMEVLEHVVDREPVLARLQQMLAPGGHLVVSVPVETGLPLAVKQVVRTIAGWRGIGDYPGTEPYRWSEWIPSLLAGARQHIARPVHQDAAGPPFHDHKGFNWMVLRDDIARRFVLEEVLSSPLSSLPPHLGTQAWFIARNDERSLSGTAGGAV